MADFTLEAGVAPRLRDALAGVDSTVATALGGLTATAGELNIMDNCTATAAEINAMCDVTAGTYAAELVAAAKNSRVNTALTDAGAATCPVNGITVIGHVDDVTAATLAAPTLGSHIRVVSGSAFAHTVTVTEPVHFKGCGSDGTKHIATFHNTGDESLEAVYESATVWRVVAVNGVTFS